MSDTKPIVVETCKLIIHHYRNLIQYSPDRSIGFNTRIFSHMLHPELHFVSAGKSTEVNGESATHPEHIVPCAVLIAESKRLIREGKLSDDEIAKLLAKHWKVATITKAEAHRLDYELGLKSNMPDGWSFEHGDTLERLNTAGIKLQRKQ